MLYSTTYTTLVQLVSTLVEEAEQPGVHESVFNGADRASGVHFYRLRAGEYVETKKNDARQIGMGILNGRTLLRIPGAFTRLPDILRGSTFRLNGDRQRLIDTAFTAGKFRSLPLLLALPVLLTLTGTAALPAARPSSGDAYRAIDAHALAAPASVESSVKSLAAWLTAPCRSDEEKARAIFRWITENIRYDVDAFFAGNPLSGDAAEALKSRSGVCEGYAGLFSELAKASGMEAARITGYAKGYGYTPGDPIGTVPNHAWNAVRINGRWRLIDCTWGAGYIGDDRSFHRSFDPHFFLTPPGEFIFDHLPEKESWQLLDSPVSRETFERSVHVKSGFYNLGLSLGPNTEGTLRAEGEIVLRLGLTRPVTGVAALLRGEKSTDDRCAFVQNERNTLVVRVTPPDAGVYSLRLFARGAEDTGPYGWILDYRIESMRRAPDLPAYPRKFSEFDKGNVRVVEPMTGILSAGSVQVFRIMIPPGDQAAVIVNDSWTFLKQAGEEWNGTVAIQPGTISLCAKHPGRDEWETLLEYRGQ